MFFILSDNGVVLAADGTLLSDLGLDNIYQLADRLQGDPITTEETGDTITISGNSFRYEKDQIETLLGSACIYHLSMATSVSTIDEHQDDTDDAIDTEQAIEAAMASAVAAADMIGIDDLDTPDKSSQTATTKPDTQIGVDEVPIETSAISLDEIDNLDISENLSILTEDEATIAPDISAIDESIAIDHQAKELSVNDELLKMLNEIEDTEDSTISTPAQEPAPQNQTTISDPTHDDGLPSLLDIVDEKPESATLQTPSTTDKSDQTDELLDILNLDEEPVSKPAVEPIVPTDDTTDTANDASLEILDLGDIDDLIPSADTPAPEPTPEPSIIPSSQTAPQPQNIEPEEASLSDILGLGDADSGSVSSPSIADTDTTADDGLDDILDLGLPADEAEAVTEEDELPDLGDIDELLGLLDADQPSTQAEQPTPIQDIDTTTHIDEIATNDITISERPLEDYSTNAASIGIDIDEYSLFIQQFLDDMQEYMPGLTGDDPLQHKQALSSVKDAAQLLNLTKLSSVLEQLDGATSNEKALLLETFESYIAQIKHDMASDAVSEPATITTNDPAPAQAPTEPAPQAAEPTIMEPEPAVEIVTPAQPQQTTQTPPQSTPSAPVSTEASSPNPLDIDIDAIKPIQFEFSSQTAANELGLPKELVDEFVTDFIQQAYENIPVFQNAYKDKDLEKINKTAHLLKGAASNLHIVPLAKTMEEMQYSETFDNIPTLFRQFIGQLKMLEGYISKLN